MGIEAAIIGSAIVGGVSSSRAAKKAAKAQGAAADATVAESRRQYDQTRQDWAPYREFGYNALENLSDPQANFMVSPGYNFVRDQGIKSTDNAFSMRSPGGNAMKALADYTNNLASLEYNNWWNRQIGAAQVGSGATANTQSAGQFATQNIGNALMNKGNSQAQGYYNAAAGINNSLQAGIGNYLYGKGRGII